MCVHGVSRNIMKVIMASKTCNYSVTVWNCAVDHNQPISCCKADNLPKVVTVLGTAIVLCLS